MQPTVAEQIAAWLVAQEITQVFCVTGGGAMFLNYAFGSHPLMNCVFMHHEQACAMAAEGYARISGKPAVLNVTTGPGGINALNGVFGAWTDSIPMVVISGQVKRETGLDFVPVSGLRQLGDQEGPVIHMARHVTKYARLVKEPEELATLLPEAYCAAITGRPGPAWLDIPSDIQAARVPIDLPRGPVSLKDPPVLSGEGLMRACDEVLDLLRQAHRPLILGGTGVQLSGAVDDLLRLAEAASIPVATAWTHDLIASDHPLFAGRPGSIGTRAGNFCLQAADLLLVVGSRLNIRQVSYNWARFAPNARIIQVDIDAAELDKPFVRPHVPIVADAREFLSVLSARLNCTTLPDYAEWVDWCQRIAKRYPNVTPEQRSGNTLNPYALVEHIFSRLRSDDIVVCGNASACIVPFQVGRLQTGQRMFSNSGAASMGYELPAAIGAAVAGVGRRIICVAGDGSLQMNVQELQTLKTLGLRVIVVVLDNRGYLSIRQTHENFFGRVIGATEETGLAFPDYQALAAAYGLPAGRMSSWAEISILDEVLLAEGPALVHCVVDATQGFEPRLKSRMLADGTFVTPDLDDMFPFLSAEELASVRAEAAALRTHPEVC